MVAVAPFRALRYATEVVRDLSRVVAPPYDVIDVEAQEQLYRASPYNVVRLIYGKTSSADTATDNRYTRARRDFDRWREEQVLRRDGEASFSLVEHTFPCNGSTARRLGFLGLIALDGASRQAVLRHEATLASPKEDRKKLLDAVPANLSPIFCVYPDGRAVNGLSAVGNPEESVQAMLQRIAGRTSPSATATIGEEAVRIWAVTDPEVIAVIQRRLAAANALIADGHHRFEVAYGQRELYGAVMTYFVSMRDPGLRIRPIHRLVRNPDIRTVAALEPLCTFERVDGLDALLPWLHEEAPGRFGCAIRGVLYKVAVIRARLEQWLKEPSVPGPLAGLDVSILHQLLFPTLGIEEGRFTYTADAVQALASVETQTSSMAWLMRGIPIDQVYGVASQGFTLPPKSTFFYPKVPSGLAFNIFD